MIVSKIKFYNTVALNKYKMFQEVPEKYKNGFIPNHESIYVLNNANNLVAFYNAITKEYMIYSKPMRTFSKTKRKFVKVTR